MLWLLITLLPSLIDGFMFELLRGSPKGTASSVLGPISVCGLGGLGGGCGAPSMCMPSMPSLSLPSLSLPSLSMPSLCPPAGGGAVCAPAPTPGCRKKRQANRSPALAVSSDERKCNNEQIREIIVEGIRKHPKHAKSVIHSEIRSKIGGNWVVVCASQPLSFVTQSQEYCLDGYYNTWCYAFQID